MGTASSVKCAGDGTLGLLPTTATGSACSPVSPNRLRGRPLPANPKADNVSSYTASRVFCSASKGAFPLQPKWPPRLQRSARSSSTALGPVPDELSRAEADLRIYAHDLRHWAHDKDYCCLAAYPLPFFSRHRLLFLRVDSRGHVTSEEP